MNVAQASAENLGTWSSMSRENSKRWSCEDESTEAKNRGGTARSSDENP